MTQSKRKTNIAYMRGADDQQKRVRESNQNTSTVGVQVAQFQRFYPFVIYLLAIRLPVLLFRAFCHSFGIFKLYLY
jgi:hypothetical protein